MADVSSCSRNALKQVIDPYLEQDLVTAKSVRTSRSTAALVVVDVRARYPAQGWQADLAPS